MDLSSFKSNDDLFLTIVYFVRIILETYRWIIYEKSVNLFTVVYIFKETTNEIELIINLNNDKKKNNFINLEHSLY